MLLASKLIDFHRTQSRQRVDYFDQLGHQKFDASLTKLFGQYGTLHPYI